jgi:hypothetical protein
VKASVGWWVASRESTSRQVDWVVVVVLGIVVEGPEARGGRRGGARRRPESNSKSTPQNLTGKWQVDN